MNAFVDSLVRISEASVRQNGYVRNLVRTYGSSPVRAADKRG